MGHEQRVIYSVIVRRILLVANPASSGFTGALYRDVVKILENKFSVSPIWPINASEAKERAIEAAADGCDIVVAMGGDGVIHHIANGLVGTQTALGIIPSGTANVLARIHGLPRDPRAAAQALSDARPVSTRVVKIEITNGQESATEYVTFSLGVGFDADVVKVAERSPHSKLNFGSLHFAKSAISRVYGPYRDRDPDIDVEIDGTHFGTVGSFVQVHNLYTYFGRIAIRLAPSALDGPVVLTASRLDPSIALKIIARLMVQRDPTVLPGIAIKQGFNQIKISASKPIPVQADGEHLGEILAMNVTPIEDALIALRN